MGRGVHGSGNFGIKSGDSYLFIMGTTVEISQLLSWAVPFLIMYNAWLHRMVIKTQLDIAVNTAKDEEIFKQIDEMKADIRDIRGDLQSMRSEIQKALTRVK
jgi:hypothetical protein